MRPWPGALLFWLVVTACANEDVVLFDFRGSGAAGASGTPSTSGTGGAAASGTAGSEDGTLTGGSPDGGAGDVTGASSPPPSCQSNGDCPDGWSCEKPSCSATTGSCITHPVCFDRTPSPVCGCDGVTYWNDCLRKQVGPGASTPGQCEGSAEVCRNATDCGGTSTACGHLLLPADACGAGMFGQHGPGPDMQGNPPPPGTCWSLPDSCDATTDPFRWTECAASAPASCLDTCSALRTGRLFVQSASDVCP